VNWRNDAACRGHDVAVFFPERGTSPEPGKAICATCPVRAECLAAADDDGIWGGTTAVERKPRRATR
jgi:WhiB family redox-sensing transcriptional regulator